MFQNLRASNTVFILNKSGSPTMERGTVVSVSTPMPKYQVPPVFGQPQEMVVDLVVKINNADTSFQKLPAAADIADFGTSGLVISDSRDAMNAEVLSLKQKSVDTVGSVDYHKDVIARCDKILSELNPEFAEKQAQQLEINDIKTRMKEMSETMAELMEMNRTLVDKLGASSVSKPKE